MGTCSPMSRRDNGGYAYAHFDQARQLRRLCLRGLCNWLVTVAIVASIYGVLIHYSSREAMVKSKKHEFNALIAGLSILLGLNTANSFKGMLGDLRWWLLSLYEWSPREADLVLQSENILHLMQLMRISRRFLIWAYVVFWVVVNVASQVAVATLGLTYSVNTADKIAPTTPGNVSVPDLSAIQTTKVISSKSQTLNALRYTANTYGNVALASISTDLAQVPQPGTIFSPEAPQVYCDNTSCMYVFYEATPEYLPYYTQVTTNRTVTANVTCDSWPVIHGGAGALYNITIDDEDKSVVELPAIYGPLQTTFIVDPNNDIGNASARISAFEASSTDPWYYDCNVTIGPVQNAVLKVHELNTNITSLAAPAIALQGYGSSEIGSNVSTNLQFQSYPAESFYGDAANGSTDTMSVNIAQFTIGVIQVTALANTNILAWGLLPLKGIRLDISSWEHIHIILGLTVGLQFLIGAITMLLANRVLVRDHSHLSMTAFLRPAVNEIGHRGALANEKQMASLFKHGTTMRYVQGSNGMYHVRIS